MVASRADTTVEPHHDQQMQYQVHDDRREDATENYWHAINISKVIVYSIQ